jgi:hypothetical protein
LAADEADQLAADEANRLSDQLAADQLAADKADQLAANEANRLADRLADQLAADEANRLSDQLAADEANRLRNQLLIYNNNQLKETKNNWLYCGNEGDTCNQVGRVRYGQGTKWFEKQNIGTIDCNVKSFGGDPIFGTHKKCYFYVNTPLVTDNTMRCGPQNNDKRCGGAQYCSSTGLCSDYVFADKYKPYGRFSGPNTIFYN